MGDEAASIRVVAGVLRDAHGRVLLAQRGEGRHLAGLWEFPGGKMDPGETPEAALARELFEEIGIRIRAARPLIAVEHDYPGRRVRLEVYEVLDYEGDPFGREGQALRWLSPEAMSAIPMPPADRPVVQALRLPPLLAISPEPSDRARFLAELEATLSSGIRFVELRAKALAAPALRALAREALPLCRRHGALLLLNGPPEWALELGLDGAHLDRERLLATRRRPLPDGVWLGVSCHDRASLERAAEIEADFALLSPVKPTASHPGAKALGWEAFAAMREGVPLSVYALGGLDPTDLEQARRFGAQGVAGISAFWKRARDDLEDAAFHPSAERSQ